MVSGCWRVAPGRGPRRCDAGGEFHEREEEEIRFLESWAQMSIHVMSIALLTMFR